MKTYNYNVIAEYENKAISIGTNSIDVAISALMEHVYKNATVDIIDGFTGEIYVTISDEEYYITKEWQKMILGWLIEDAWGE